MPSHTQTSTFSSLQTAIRLIPLIDNHAHNVLQAYEPSTDFPREMIVSEANGDALKDSVYSLAHLRMQKYLCRFLNLSAESSWREIQEASKAIDYESFCQQLIESAGIKVILFDDGFSNSQCHPISWHNKLTTYANKRIVRIETLFEVGWVTFPSYHEMNPLSVNCG